MPSFNFENFWNRSHKKAFTESDIARVIASFPIQCTTEGPWLAGGSLRRAISGNNLESDFDFFFKDELQFKTFEVNLELGYVKVKETDHHVQYRGYSDVLERNIDIQLIKFQYYNTAQEVLDSFDYTICQVVFDGVDLHVGEYTLWDIANKRLAINKITFPLSTLRRLLKYTNQGYTACSGCLNSILQLTVENPHLLSNNTEYVD